MTPLTTLSMGSLLEGFPKILPEGMTGTNPRTSLLVQVEQRQRQKTTTWCTRSGDGHCLKQLSCLCWMWAAEWPGLSWMTNLFWTVMLCCRKASCAMSSRKNAQRHGKVLQDKGLRSPLCCLADKWQMNGLTSCFLKGICGPPSLPRGLPQRWSRNELFAKNGAGCRPSTCGWTSRLSGICYSIVCTRRLVSNYMTCFLTEPPRATREIPMKRKHTVDQTTEKSRRGGSKSTVDVVLQTTMCAAGPGHQWLHTCIPGQGWECSCWDWYIHVQSGGKQGRADTSSNGDDSYLMWETRLSREMKKWTWWTSDHLHGWHGWRHTTRWKRWNERLWGRAGFIPFAMIFTGSSFLCVCWVLCCLFGCGLFRFLYRWNDSCM